MHTKKVVLYGLSTCTYCNAISKMFTDLGVEYTLVQVDSLAGLERKQAIESLKAINPTCSFPTVTIDDAVLIGYQIQEIKERLEIRTETDKLHELLRDINEKKGYFFNRNKEKTYELLRGLLTNKDRYGYMACPCRLAAGEQAQDKDIICPCEYRKPDVAEFGSCYCGLYVSEEWNTNAIEHSRVPERRPPELL